MADVPAPVGHVALVGLMGSGKTTVGRRVARTLGRPFVDLDDELERRSGRTVAEWFAERGEDAFRAAEVEVLADVLGGDDPMVVATGGGAVTTSDGRAALAAPGVTVVWLRATPELLARRVAQKGPRSGRPLLAEDPLGTLRRLASEREGWYAEVADVVVDVDPVHGSAEKPKRRLAEMVVDALSEGAAAP